jgi:hypothetical protein
VLTPPLAQSKRNSYSEIINRALRDAANAPTVFDALDICGDVMVELAELCRQAEARHV